MCELLVNLGDRANSDPYIDSKRLKRGDVIAIAEDSFSWEIGELTDAEWRIVRVPGVAADKAVAFLAPELEIDPQHPSPVLQLRGFCFDLDSALIPTDVKTWLADGTRATPIGVLSVSESELAQLKITNTRLANPAAL